MCIQAGNHKNHTAAVCHRSSSSPYGKGKGGKGRGKGKARALFVGKGKGGKSSKGKQGKGKGRGLGLYNKTTTGRSSSSIAPVKHVPGQAYSGTCFFCKKPGHAQKDCNAKKRLEAQPLFLTESTSFTGAAAVSLEKLTAAVGTNTCQECYSHTCHGPGNCDPNDISPYLPEAEARFINSGLYDLTLRMKNGASSGLQRNETPLQSAAFVTDTHSLQGHGAYGDHYYNDISPYLPEAEARFINSGLYDLTLRMKNGASSGLQRNETPLQSAAFVTDTHSLQGHGAYGDHYYNGGYGGYDTPIFNRKH